MRVLITGGAGFIGSAIVPYFQQKGCEVFVLDNLSFGKRNLLPSLDDQHFFFCDILDKDKVCEVLQTVEPSIVIHLAAIHFIPYCNLHPFEISDINIRGTENLLNSIKKISSVSKFLFASTAAVYPISDNPISEQFETKPLDIYGLTKLTGEWLCEKFNNETKIDTIICRFFNAFGPNETNPHLIPEIDDQLKSGKRTLRLGNLTPKRDFIHTHDMADAVWRLTNLDNVNFDIYNLGRGIEYAVTEVVQAFSDLLNEHISIEVDPSKVRKVERQHLLSDVAKLKSIGWEPQYSLIDGIDTMIKNWNQ
jgi:UDP-glucose 4-epimerase